MADVSLLFDVAGGGSVSGESGQAIKRQLDEIVRQISPLKIRFEADESSIASMIGQIRALNDEVISLNMNMREQRRLGGSGGGNGRGNGGNNRMTDEQAESNLLKIENLIARIQRARDKFMDDSAEFGADAGIISQLGEYISELDNLGAEVEQRTVGNNAFSRSISDIAKQFSTTSIAISEYIRVNRLAARERNSPTNLIITEGTREFAEAQSKLSSGVNQSTSAIKKYVGAMSSNNEETQNAYVGLLQSIDAYRALSERLESGTITQAQFDEELKKINADAKLNITALNQSADSTFTLDSRIKAIGNSLARVLSVMYLIRTGSRFIRDIANEVVELDSAFTQLRIVTGANSDEMERFKETSVNLAKDVGRSVTDIAGSIETFSRLGYSLADASELARNASILSNVAGVSTESATTGLTAIIKGFNFGVEEASHVSDVLVEIGQKYAVSASEMMEAYEKSGAALNATNLTFEKSAGLIAAANAAIQNSSTVGTALKTVAARIRGSKTDLIEMGEDAEDLANGFSKYAEEVKQLSGVSILEPGTTDEFRDLYDIFSDLSDVWEKLSDTQQARVSEIFGGARQLQVISSIIGNWKDAENAYVDAQNAMGAATEANNIYMESAAAKQQQMQASYQAMANSIMSSGLVGFFYDAASALFGFVGKLADLKLLIPGVVSSLVALKAVQIGIASAEATRRVSGIATQILSEKVSTDALRISVNALTNEERQRLAVMLEQQLVQKGMTADEIATTMATYGLSAANQGLAASFKAVQASIPVWGWISLAISAVITVVASLASAADSATVELQSLRDNLNAIANEASSVSKGFRDLSDSVKEVTPRFVELSTKMSLTEDEYSELSDINSKLIDLFPSLDAGMNKNGDAMISLSGDAETLTSSLNNLLDIERRLANEKIAGQLPEALKNVIDMKKATDDIVGEKSRAIAAVNDGFYVRYGDETDFRKEFEYVQDLIDLGADVTLAPVLNEMNDVVGRAYTWNPNNNVVKNYVNGLQREIDIAKDELSYSISGFNKYISAKMQTDGVYDLLAPALKDVALTAVSGVDLESANLIKGSADETEQAIDQFINKVVKQLRDVQDSIYGASELYNKGDIDKYQFLVKSDEFIKSISDFASTIPGVELDSFVSTFLDSFGLTGEAADVFTEHIKLVYPELRELADAMDDSAQSATRSASDFVEAFGNMGKGMQSLAKIYSDVKDGGTFDFAQLLSDDFRSAFSGLGDEYDEFINTIASSSGDIGACQEAFDKLVDAYIRSSGALEGVTEETYDAVVAMLKSIGVTNAEEVATRALTRAKIEAALQSYGFNESMRDEILALYDEGAAIDYVIGNIFRLAAEKIIANRTSLNTHGDIQNLIDLAKAAGATEETLARLANAKALIAKAEEYYSKAIGVSGTDRVSLDTKQGLIRTGNEYMRQAQAFIKGGTSYAPGGNATNYGTQFGGSVSTGGSGSSGSGGSSGGSSGSSSSSSNKDNWFTREYKRQKHLIELEQESYEEFFDWLDGAYKKAYKEGIIDLDDFRKYEEEVFDGRRKIFDDYIKDIDHEISMRENFEGDSAKVLALNLDAIYAIEKQIQLARKSGLTDNDDYIQDLQKQWMSYYKDIQKLLEKSYDKRLSALKDFYDKQKKLLQDAADEEKYLEEQAEKRKSVADIRAELARLEYDNSAWAQKRRLELMQALAEAEKDLNDFEKDNALNDLLDTLDKQYEEQEKRIKAEMEALSGLLNDPNSFFNKLLSDISETSKKQLYYLLLQYTDGGTGGTWSDSPVYGGTSNTTLSGTAQSGNLFTSSDGNTYSLLTSGAGAILNAIRAINNFKDIYGNQSSARPSTRGINLLNNNSAPYEIIMGDININGNADTQTVSEIRRAQRDSLNELLRGLAKLKK